MGEGSRLLISEQPLQLLPSLALKLGVNEAILLQQFYWLSRMVKAGDDGFRWLTRSVAELQKEFPFFSSSTIRRTIESLEGSEKKPKILVSIQSFNNRKSYRIDFDQLAEIDKGYAQNEHRVCSEWTEGCAQNEHSYNKELKEKSKAEETTPELALCSANPKEHQTPFHALTSDPWELEKLPKIWNYYLEQVGRSKKTYILTPERARLGLARLRDSLKFSGDHIEACRWFQLAIENLATDEFLSGKNESGKKYQEWDDHLCKNWKTFEKRRGELEDGVA